MNTSSSGANAEQARYWTEEGGPSWVREEDLYDVMLAPFNDAVLAALDPQPGERVLDIGCGFGTTSLAVAARGAEVHGVDISPPMIARAAARAEALGHAASVNFAVGDAQEDSLGGPFDAVASRFGVMFFADPVRAFRNMASSTRDGGRLAFVCWQTLDRNPWMNAASTVLRELVDDAPPPAPTNAGPFAFGDPDFVRRTLSGAGWDAVEVTPFETAVQMGGRDGVAGAVHQALTSSVARSLLANAAPAVRAQAVARLTSQFEAISVDGVVRFPSAAWVVQAQRLHG